MKKRKEQRIQKKILNSTLKEVRKYQKKHHKIPDESVIKELRIQLIHPFFRILSVTFGLFLILVAFISAANGVIGIGALSLVVGLPLTIFGFMGKKKKLNDVVNKYDFMSDLLSVIEAITLFDW